MGREVRRVPADWQHPRNDRGYVPLKLGDQYHSSVDEWDDECAKWKSGWRPDYCTSEEDRGKCYEQWAGQRPHRDDYMPNWPDDVSTHLMMYEDTTEGTPISPAFKTPEELAQWLVDNKASAFGRSLGTYEGWLRVARGGFAPSMVVIEGVTTTGVDCMSANA